MEDTDDSPLAPSVVPYGGAADQAKAQEIIDRSESTTTAGKKRDKIRTLATLSQFLERQSRRLEQQENDHFKRLSEMQREAAELQLFLAEKNRQTQEQWAAIVLNTASIASAYAESSLKPSAPQPTAGESAVAALSKLTSLVESLGKALIVNQPAIGYKVASLIAPSVPMPEPSKIPAGTEQTEPQGNNDPSVDDLYTLLQSVDANKLSEKLRSLGLRDDQVSKLPLSALRELHDAQG